MLHALRLGSVAGTMLLSTAYGACEPWASDTDPTDVPRSHVEDVTTSPFTYHIRRFDEAKEALAVKTYLEKYAPQRVPGQVDWFRKMREEMTPHQGEACQTRLQVIRLGDLVFVGIPGEMSARLGLELRRRSPFRHTCIIGLTNENIGYIPDRRSYAEGNYEPESARCAAGSRRCCGTSPRGRRVSSLRR